MGSLSVFKIESHRGSRGVGGRDVDRGSQPDGVAPICHPTREATFMTLPGMSLTQGMVNSSPLA
jgi:hypothetical protein